jgi:integrase
LKEHYKKDAFLLTGDKDRFIEPRVMQNRFKRILKKCGIEDANFHSTRHTFATRCVELNFDIKSLSEILGHASVTITMNKYVHPSMELKAENMNKFSGLFGE